jgi:two-component system sensor histidine kinase DesK
MACATTKAERMAERSRWLPILDHGAMPYLWLVYAAFVPVGLWFGDLPPRVVAVQLVLLAAFLVLYVTGYGRRGRAALLIAGATALLGAIAAPYPSAITYFIYAATFVAWGVPARQAYAIIGGYPLAILLVAWRTGLPRWAAATAIVFSVVVGLANVFTANEKRANARLREANDEIERLAKIAERERIGRDLHDVLGHTLSLITLKSELASRLAERDPAHAAAEIREVEQIARASLDDLRAALAGYRGAGIDSELAHARDVLSGAGLAVDCVADDVRLAPAAEGVLALAIRESVTNVLRHARAGAVRLRLVCVENVCRFEIHDDGVGGTAPDGFGLRGMRERVETVGGTVLRTADRGTHVIVTLPLPAGADR